MAETKRISKWDNAKGILILLVVWGHFVNEYARPADGDVIMKGISILIYLFHMPCFIFLAGLFARRPDRDHPFRWDRVVSFILLGYLLKVIIFLIKSGFGRKPEFMWLSDTGMPWYMFAMAAFMVLTLILRDVSPRIILPLSLAAACLAGYCDGIGSFLNLSRILVFFPYYYLGYITDAGHLGAFLKKKEVRRTAVLAFLAAVILIVLYTRPVYLSIRMFTGRNPYSKIPLPSYKAGAFYRLLSYLVSGVMGISFLSLVPDRELPVITGMGRRTLQIYFWHRLVLYGMVYTGFNDWLVLTFPLLWRILYLGIAAGITVLFAAPVFDFPIRGINRIVNK